MENIKLPNKISFKDRLDIKLNGFTYINYKGKYIKVTLDSEISRFNFYINTDNSYEYIGYLDF